jgi:sugar (pentulose or hexulose) kinase
MKKNSEKFLIGLDLGTSAIKAVLMDANGEISAEAVRHTRFVEPHQGWLELQPEKHYQDVCSAIKELAGKAPGEISALAMAAASGNTLLTDSQGKPLTSIISWMDQRAVQKLPASLANLTVQEVRQITGWPCVNTFPLAHLAWFKENEAELYTSAERCCMNTDWILFRLTGNWLMDYSTAATSHLQNQTKLKYHRKFLDLLKIPEDKLSKLSPSAFPAGNLTAQAQKDTGLSESTKIITGCFDHPAAARALGVLEPGQLLLSCGTSWVGFFPENDRSKIIDLELLCDPFMSNSGGSWGAIFSVPYIGRTIDWYVDKQIAPGEKNKFKIFDELAAQAKPGANGLKIDLRLPPAPVNASPENISRAVMENAAELLNEKIIDLKKADIIFESAVMVGGPSKSPIWPDIVEEITGIKLTVGSQHAGAKGAAIIAGIGAGIYKDEFDALKIIKGY